MGLNFVAEYLKIPLEMAVDLRRRQERGNQAQDKLVQGSRSGGPETFHYYESSTSNNGTIPLSPTLSEYIERRFIPTLYWYQNKARSNSMKFNIWKVVIISSALFLAKIHESRIHFTRVKQRLEREYQLFMLRAKHYARREGISDSYSTQLFVENIESILTND